MTFLVLLALFTTPQIDCQIVREKVAEYGKAKALAWAVRNGYSVSEINAARRCLSRGKE